MPAKNAIKEYEPGGYYHVYNRGVEKRLIFEEEKDYKVFLSYLEFYLTPQEIIFDNGVLRGLSSQERIPPSKVLKNYFGEMRLLAYCLMPNHFHLLLQQNSEHGMDHFMRSLSTKYVRYFNTKNKRVGPLFQGPYKAVKIEDEYQFTYLTKYIHRNPVEMLACEDSPRRLEEYKYSSYGNYLKKFNQTWVKTEDVLCLFSKAGGQNSYQNFVEEKNSDDLKIVYKLMMDLD